MKNVTAIVVARAGSKRLPGKAMLPFGQSTLVGHKVAQLRVCEGVARVIIGSDSPEILAEGVRCGAIALPRDPVFCDEVSRTANDMIEDVASRVTGDVILWAHPTNPLVTPDTYAWALTVFYGRAAEKDSLMSVTGIRRHAWWKREPLNHHPWTGRHQIGGELEPVMFQDGAIFIQPRLQMLANRSFYGRSPILFELSADESVDIDLPRDYVTAKALHEWKYRGGSL